MKIIEQSAEIIDKINGEEILKKIELAGRTCYQSMDKIKPGSAAEFVASRIKAGHESILEHVSVTVKLITDRGVLAELTRHREARAVLPMSTKTEIIMTANLREWRTIFGQRCAPSAHPQMRDLMLKLLRKMSDAIPVVFDDLVDMYL